MTACVVCHRQLTLEDEAMAVTVPDGFGTGSLCSYCQDRHGVTVTADADGWITDIQTARELRLDFLAGWGPQRLALHLLFRRHAILVDADHGLLAGVD